MHVSSSGTVSSQFSAVQVSARYTSHNSQSVVRQDVSPASDVQQLRRGEARVETSVSISLSEARESIAEQRGGRGIGWAYGRHAGPMKHGHAKHDDAIEQGGQMTARDLRNQLRADRQAPVAAEPQAEAGSASSVAQIASQQALSLVSATSVSISIAAASFESSASFGGTVSGDLTQPEQLAAPAPEFQSVNEDTPSAAMLELARIQAEQAVEAEVDTPDDSPEIEDLGDLFELAFSGELAEMDPMDVIEQVAALFGVEMDFGGPEESGDPMQIGALSGEVGGSFAASEASLAAFSLEASMTTATFADGSTVTSMSVNFSAIAAYSRTMEYSV
jgi:hypothetical protein